MRTLHFIGASAVALALGAAPACSSNNSSSGPTGSGGMSSSNGTGGASSSTTSATTGTTATTGGTGGTGGSTTGTGGSGCTGATPVALTVKNALVWCSVSVDGQAASSAAEQTVCVASGKTVTVTATPLSGFELGSAPWHDTDGDSGSGDMGTVANNTSTAKVTVTGTADCAWVCCPFSPGGNGCPTTDQCP